MLANLCSLGQVAKLIQSHERWLMYAVQAKWPS